MLLKSQILSIPYQQKVRLGIMAACLMAILLTSLALTLWGISGIKKAILRDSESIASLIGSRNDVALEFENADFTNKNIRILEGNQQILATCIYNKKGALFASYEAKASLVTCPDSDGWYSGGYTEKSEFAENHLYTSKNIFSSQTPGNIELLGKVVVYSSLKEMDVFLRDQIITSLVIIAITLLLCYLMTRKLGQFISNPVVHLAESTRSITHQADLSARVDNPYNDELGQIIDCFNKVLQEREKSHLEYRKKCMDHVKAYANTNLVMKKLLAEFNVPYRSLVVLADLFQKRSLGKNLAHYTNYLGDLEADMDCYRNCIESTLALTEVYERSVSKDTIVLTLMNVIESEYNTLPFARLDFQCDTQRNIRFITVEAYEEAFIKTLSLCYSVLALIAVAMDRPLQHVTRVYQDKNSLLVELKIDFLNSDSAPKISESDSLDSLISNIKSGKLMVEASDQISCHPCNALLLTDANIKPEEYRYLIDSIKYIANVNGILVSDHLQYAGLSLTLDLSACYNSDVDQLSEKSDLI